MSQTLKPGTHKCVVTKAINGWFCQSASGTDGIRIPLEITEGPCEGVLVDYIAWLSHAALPGSMKTLAKALGFNGDLRTLTDINNSPLVGKFAEIVCQEEEYKGKVSVKVKFLNPCGAASLSGDSIAALIAKLNETSMKLAVQLDDDAPKAAPKMPPRPPADKDLDISDSEIPF